MRTDEDKIVGAPIVVILGGQEYRIKPLVIRDSREWRKKLIKAFGILPKYLNMTTDNPEGFTQALDSMLGEMPEVVADLFFSYAKDLDRDEIETTANDSELAEAFQEVMKFAFPLSQSLTKILAGRT